MVAECTGTPGANGTDTTVGWRYSVDGVVLNYREQGYQVGTNMMTKDVWFQPARIRFDETPAHLMANAMWSETFTELTTLMGVTTMQMKTVNWKVLAVGETVMVTVSGGQPKVYMNTLKLTHSNSMGMADAKTYWYARGIGKVKEIGGQSEELIDYTLAP